jgi:hypothetical protein
MNNVYFNGAVCGPNVYLSANAIYSVLRKLAILGHGFIGSLQFSTFEDNYLMGSGPGGTAYYGGYSTIYPDTVIRRCFFGWDTITNCSMLGLFEDCVGLRNFPSGTNGYALYGTMRRCKCYKMTADGGVAQIVSNAEIEDCEFIINPGASRAVFSLVGSAPTFRRVTVRDPNGSSTAYSLVFAYSGNANARISYCELRNGIDPQVINVLGTGYNIVT